VQLINAYRVITVYISTKLMSTISFNTKNPAFFLTLRQKVDKYFKENNIKPTGNIQLYLKTAILFTLLASSYFLLLFVPMPFLVNIILWAVIGVLFAAIGFSVMHDGAHGSYSSKKWVNEIMSNSLHLLGGSAFLWKAKHNINHHTFTNIDGVDDDIDVQPWLRIHPSQPRRWFHRFQHIYWTLLYGLTYISWIYWRDFIKYFSKKIGTLPIKKMSLRDHIEFWAWKVIYTFAFIVVPVFKLGFVQTIIGYSVLCFVCGFIISVIFQLAHVVEHSNFPVPDEKNSIDENWAIHQVNTTANFATKNKLISWYSGGLNYQIEHHIFPRISHVHYPAISRLMKETCEQFKVNYREFSFFGAILSHARYLKMLGTR
jgi:linoleoyl-CoA desaturase